MPMGPRKIPKESQDESLIYRTYIEKSRAARKVGSTEASRFYKAKAKKIRYEE